MISALGDRRVADEALRFGANEYLVKPVDAWPSGVKIDDSILSLGNFVNATQRKERKGLTASVVRPLLIF